MVTHIYDRPDLDQRRGNLALYISGTPAKAKPNAAYEGRLLIHNQVGAATVEQIDGAELPPGHSLYVQGNEVVIAWPAYQETGVVPLADGNGNFERGDVGWIKDAGWSIEASGNGNDGFGVGVGVFRGQGQAFMEAEAYAPTFPGQQFTAQVNVQQGASSKYNVGAGIGVRFYDRSKNLLALQLGTFIDDGSKGAWHMSTGSFRSPDGAWLARAVIRGNRTRENKPLWVDDAAWTLQATLGINHEAQLPVTLRIRDSGGRSVLWSGTLLVTGYPSWLVYQTANSTVRVYPGSNFAVTPTPIPINDLQLRSGGLAFPRGVVLLYTQGVLNNAISRNGDVAAWSSFLTDSGVPNRIAYFGDVMLCTRDSFTVWRYSLDDGLTFTNAPSGNTARAFLACRTFAVKFVASNRPPEISTVFPFNWIAFSNITAAAIQCGIEDLDNDRVAWVVNGTGVGRTLYIRTISLLRTVSIPVGGTAQAMARYGSGWLVAYGSEGLWRVDDSDTVTKVFTGNVTWVASKDGYSILVSGGVMYSSIDGGTTWTEITGLDYTPVFAVPLWDV